MKVKTILMANTAGRPVLGEVPYLRFNSPLFKGCEGQSREGLAAIGVAAEGDRAELSGRRRLAPQQDRGAPAVVGAEAVDVGVADEPDRRASGDAAAGPPAVDKLRTRLVQGGVVVAADGFEVLVPTEGARPPAPQPAALEN